MKKFLIHLTRTKKYKKPRRKKKNREKKKKVKRIKKNINEKSFYKALILQALKKLVFCRSPFAQRMLKIGMGSDDWTKPLNPTPTF